MNPSIEVAHGFWACVLCSFQGLPLLLIVIVRMTARSGKEKVGEVRYRRVDLPSWSYMIFFSIFFLLVRLFRLLLLLSLVVLSVDVENKMPVNCIQ